MICPNCKTELVEVNGRYICSDCGREIPENEVMASDWGNGGTVRAGLYGAGTDEPTDEVAPVADYNKSLTESEGGQELADSPVDVTLDPDQITTPQVEPDEPTVEEVLQTQTSEPEPEVPVTDTGFYTAESSGVEKEILKPVQDEVIASKVEESTPVIPIPTPVIPTSPTVISTEVEKSLSHSEPSEESSAPNHGSFVTTQDDGMVTPEIAPIPGVVEPIPVVPEAQEIPINIPEIKPEEPTPEHTEVVRDMFENAEVASAPQGVDPGIYSDPLFEANSGSEQPQSVNATNNAPMPLDKKTNLVIAVIGSVLVLALIAGGTWGYLALTTTSQPNIADVVDETPIEWQEFQSVDGGFRIKFPDQPETLLGTQMINGTETDLTEYAYTSEDNLYAVKFVALDAVKAKAVSDNLKTVLPKMAGEIAKPLNLTVTDTKIGKYYTADAIDFTMTNDTASYQAKLMINGQKYILVMAGSASSQTVDFDKFIKSFAFNAGSTE